MVMDVIWRVNAGWIATFAVAFVSIEGVYGSALVNKFAEGGWVPFAIAALLLVPTLSWTYGRKLKARYDLVGDAFVGSAVAALKEAAESAEEAEAVGSALGDGYVVVFGRTILHMGGEHNWFKRFVINHLYRFLQKNFKSSVSMLKIDHAKTLQQDCRMISSLTAALQLNTIVVLTDTQDELKVQLLLQLSLLQRFEERVLCKRIGFIVSPTIWNWEAGFGY
ncbi:potassium transporter 6-like [Panicum miliaceum]|uniref:Potassium transporter 6-like n=1 Tax=Panicum miliaceum TaxID=4540 RepID=A0A3L6SU41_PANMI|nr:potassium transporter 6-like [Panicum miliaceum]